MSSQDHRETLVVRRRLQPRIVAGLGLVPIALLVAGAVALGLLIGDLEREARQRAVQLRSVTPLLCGLVGVVLVTSCVLLTQALRLSNRIAGPLVRVRQVVDDVLAGNSAMRVQIRPRDYLHDAADDINRLIVHIDDLRRTSAQAAWTAESATDPAAADADAMLAAQPSPFADNTAARR